MVAITFYWNIFVDSPFDEIYKIVNKYIKFSIFYKYIKFTAHLKHKNLLPFEKIYVWITWRYNWEIIFTSTIGWVFISTEDFTARGAHTSTFGNSYFIKRYIERALSSQTHV